MKKDLFIIIALSIMTIPAFASTKCVNLPTTATCTVSDEQVFKGKPHWNVTCNGINVQGVADCFSTGSNTAGSTTIAGGPTTSETLTENIYCKCKIVSPFVSRWITPGSCTNQLCYNIPFTSDTCKSDCAMFCAIYLDATFWDFKQVYKTNIFTSRESVQ